MRQRSINAQLREKILSLDSTGLRIEFFRPDEGMKVYHLGRGIIMDLAEEAGALYKIDRSCVINKELFDQNLQNYKVEPGRRHEICRKIPLEHLDKSKI